MKDILKQFDDGAFYPVCEKPAEEWEIIGNALETQKKEFKKLLDEIVGEEATEADGWDIIDENGSCCPGDDCADGYNQKRNEIIEIIKKYEQF